MQQLAGNSRGDDELRARRLRRLQHLAIEDGTGTGHQLRTLFTQDPDGLETELRTQGHFQGGQATGGQGIGQRQDILLASDGDNRQDSRLGTQFVDQSDLVCHGDGRVIVFHSS